MRKILGGDCQDGCNVVEIQAKVGEQVCVIGLDGGLKLLRILKSFAALKQGDERVCLDKVSSALAVAYVGLCDFDHVCTMNPGRYRRKVAVIYRYI